MVQFDNRYAQLPTRFYQRIAPVPVAAPAVFFCNESLADLLGIDAEMRRKESAAALFSGNNLPAGADPIAQAYAGHQFGQFVPQLGDGRAILLGEVAAKDGKRYDWQLKGSGQTAFSRMGDGRAALGPVIRECILSEAMHALGIPTTRSLAAVTTGERVQREVGLPGAILNRVASSHVRVGTFEYFAAQADKEAIRLLMDYVIERHYPVCAEADNPALELLAQLCEAQARLVAKWMGVGFIHGVMNTDNTSIAGETIDYGPCAFMDQYDPGAVFSSIDHFGRYAYGNQGPIMQWNITRLAECLLSAIDADSETAKARASEMIDRFPQQFADAWLQVMGAKLGLQDAGMEELPLIESLLALMQAHHMDYTLTFRQLSEGLTQDAEIRLPELFSQSEEGRAWVRRWLDRLSHEEQNRNAIAACMCRQNPAYIARNHRVEEAIGAAVESEDFAPMHKLMQVLSRPFDAQPDAEEYRTPPRPEERVYQTFCGT